MMKRLLCATVFVVFLFRADGVMLMAQLPIPDVIGDDDRILPWNARTVRAKEKTEQVKIQADQFRRSLPAAPPVGSERLASVNERMSEIEESLSLLTTQLISVQDVVGEQQKVIAKTGEVAKQAAGEAVGDVAAKVEAVKGVVEEGKEERGRLGTIIDGVKSKVSAPREAAAWTVGKVATAFGIPTAGIVAIGLGICVVLWRRKVKPMVAADIAAYRETGDDTFLQGAAERIPGRLGSAISIAVDRAVERHLGPAGGGAEPEAAPAKKARRTS